ncbi:MAG: hypothetical protein GY937_08150 [bacterium]|nr:hypothetical protein [bacterium]
MGILTETWLGFLGTFLGLYALYRFTQLSVVLALALSFYWGLLGYHVGSATGEFGVAPLLAGLGLAIGAWLHRDGFAGTIRTARVAGPGSVSGGIAVHQRVSARTDRPFPGRRDDDIIDAEYRVVS